MLQHPRSRRAMLAREALRGRWRLAHVSGEMQTQDILHRDSNNEVVVLSEMSKMLRRDGRYAINPGNESRGELPP